MSEQDTRDRSQGGNTPRGPNPTGGRKRDAAFYEALDRAQGTPDLPKGTNRFTATRLLANRGFARSQGWHPTLVAQLDFYIGKTRPLDWLPGNLRIVWPTVEDTAEELGVTEDTVRTNDRKLMLLGAIAFHDSANYKRYGKRKLDESGKPTGPILEACGIDVAPVALLLPDLQRDAAAYMASKRKHKSLRRTLSRARRHARTALDEAARDGIFAQTELEPLHSTLADIELCQRPDRLSLEELAATCDAAERFHEELAARIRTASTDFSSGNIPAKARVRPVPQLHTKKNSVQNLVAADPQPETPTPTPAGSAAPPGPEGGEGSGRQTSYHPEDIRGPAGDQVLKALSPRIARYLPASGEPSMAEFVDAADRARRDLKISAPLWGAACRRMSPGGAALALAHVAAKWDAGKIEETPGAYFHGVLKKALRGELNLARSLWGMVRTAADEPGPDPNTPPSRPTPPAYPEADAAQSGQAPHSSGLAATTSLSTLPSLFPEQPPTPATRIVAGRVVMRHVCSGMPDPDRGGMMQAWLDLVRSRSRWPYLDEVRTRYAEIRRQKASPGTSGTDQFPMNGRWT